MKLIPTLLNKSPGNWDTWLPYQKVCRPSTSYASLFLRYDPTKEKSHLWFWLSYPDNDQKADVSGTFNSDWACEMGCLYVYGRGYNIYNPSC